MVLATDAHGNELLGVTQGTASDAPLTGALVVAIGPEGVLLVHDVWRDQWEVAGGGIEAGESAEEASVREVAEESGQQLTAIRRVGRATFRLVSDGRVEQADLFKGDVREGAPFVANEETDAIRWWDGETHLSGLGAIDAELIQWVLGVDGAEGA
jgi:8-oxo-dGTP diphosphatase